ncbi:hypothetical protein Tco_0356724 [Tanacetum coccineum]
MPPKPDLSFSGLEEFTSEPIVIKPIVEKSEAKASEAKPKAVDCKKAKNFNAARPKEVVNAARPKAVVNAVKGNNVNAVKASTCWVWKPKTKVLDHVSKQNNYEEIDGGYVAFRGNPKGGKITGKGTKACDDSQADCNIKAINIILQGLPTEIYALMPLEQFQVNTKFLNTLPSKWSKFVTDVKLVKDLHTTNVDQIHAHLEQHERHANEARLMHERNFDPLALVASHQMTQSPYQSHQYSY